MKSALTLYGSDIIVGVTVVDAAGNLVSSSQGVNFNIQRRSDSNWWNTATEEFDLASEPSLIAASQVGTSGVYELTLSGAYDSESLNYVVRINTTGTVAQNFYINDELIGDGLKYSRVILSTTAKALAGIRKILAHLGHLGSSLGKLYSLINDIKVIIARLRNNNR